MLSVTIFKSFKFMAFIYCHINAITENKHPYKMTNKIKISSVGHSLCSAIVVFIYIHWWQMRTEMIMFKLLIK